MDFSYEKFFKNALDPDYVDWVKNREGNDNAVWFYLLVEATKKWGEDKGLNDPKAQLNKVIEEVGEIAHEITRNNYDTAEITDAIGDTLVTIIILANILNREPIVCLAQAYNEIAHRTGKTENGTFIKEKKDEQ
jgi:NTP pyrophosphatase (non-canonical NTP hydrolase)